jgi:pimeloyl-ACP methyl ester carboxylesterase
MSGRTDTTEFLKTVSIPALVICGEYDQITPPDVMKAMSDNISNAQFHLIRNSGHLAPMEDAETVNALIRNFLKNL